MNEIESRVAYLLAVLVFTGCGSSAPTDFNSPDQGGAAQQGGSGGSAPSGAGGVLQGGTAGAPPGGTGGTAQGGGSGIGGSAGSAQGGDAGTGLGGTNAGSAGALASGGSSTGGSTGARGGTGGSGTTSFACGALMCVQGRQLCVHTPPPMSGGPQQFMCLPMPDNCATSDCACFCKSALTSPCESGTVCMCSGDPGRVTVVCGGS